MKYAIRSTCWGGWSPRTMRCSLCFFRTHAVAYLQHAVVSFIIITHLQLCRPELLQYYVPLAYMKMNMNKDMYVVRVARS